MSSVESRVTGLRCVHCSAHEAMEPGVYVCSRCGGNLLVEYDYDAIRAAWNRSDLEACRDNTMWRYAPLYPVERRIEAPPIGWTPLFSTPRLGDALGMKHLYVKDDGRNPSASFKDRASAIAIVRAQEIGVDLVSGASTGNAASSTAVLAAATGMRARIFVPRAAPKAKVAQLMAFGADLYAVDGTYDNAFDLCLAATRKFGWYNRNTGFNPYTREGKKSVSFEICEQLGWRVPDLVVVPVGDGNIISGVWKGFVEFHRLGFIDRLPKLLAAQAEGSASVMNAVRGDGTIRPVTGDTVADSISVSVPRDGEAAVRAVRESGGFAVAVPDSQILDAILTLARLGGVFAEPAAASSLAALKAAVAGGLVDPEWRCVLLVTGNGLKDVGAVMKITGEPPILPPDELCLDKVFGRELCRGH